MMNLAVFDLDGTLLQTSGVDDECYARAVADVFGIREICTDWGSYSDSTDAGILDDLLRRHCGRPMSDRDRLAQQDRFVELLETQARSAPHRFAATVGAADVLELLRRTGWTLALATGGWKRSALLKLRTAGLELGDAPAAFADDHRSREGIIRHAVRQASERHAGAAQTHQTPTRQGEWPQETAAADQCLVGHRIVYIGDGVWDLRAARRLGIGFLGVGRGAKAAALSAEGAGSVVEDFRDAHQTVRLLDAAINARP